MTVQEALVALRKNLKISQEGLARKLDLALMTVSRYETKKPPAGNVLLKLSELAASEGQKELAQVFRQEWQAELSQEIQGALSSGRFVKIPIEQVHELRNLLRDLDTEWAGVREELRTEPRSEEPIGRMDAIERKLWEWVYPWIGKAQ